jgi:hypothetical protein
MVSVMYVGVHSITCPLSYRGVCDIYQGRIHVRIGDTLDSLISTML